MSAVYIGAAFIIQRLLSVESLQVRTTSITAGACLTSYVAAANAYSAALRASSSRADKIGSPSNDSDERPSTPTGVSPTRVMR